MNKSFSLVSSGFVCVLPQTNMSKSVCLWRERVRLFAKQVRVQSIYSSHTVLCRTSWQIKWNISFISCQIHGRQQSQCPGFAWRLPKGGVPLDVTFLCPTGELQQQCPFSSSCPSQHSWSSSERYLEIDTWVTCWAHQVASVFQQEVLIFANSLVPGRACVYPRRALLNSSVQFLFVSCPVNQNKPIYAVSSREQDLLPVLVICTNCSPEILISTGSSPVEPGTQGDTQLSLLHLSHLNVFWLDLCFACLENFSSEHQMNPSVLLSTLHHVKIP